MFWRPARVRNVTLPAAVLSLLMSSSAISLDIQGHRGARGLLPENTLPAFARALEIGVTTLELDCAITRDRVVVVSHDSVLNPDLTRDAQGAWLTSAGPAIWRLAFDDLQRYDVGRVKPGSAYARRFPRQQAVDGTRIPKLADVFALVTRSGDESVRFNIETKLSPLRPDETPAPEAFVRAILEVAAQAGMTHRVSIQSFDWRTLQVVQNEAPHVPTVYLTAQGTSPRNIAADSSAPGWTAGFHASRFAGSVPRMVKAAGGSAWSPYYGDLTRGALKEAHALDLKVLVWTVNSEADMRRLMDWGVDGIISDYPDRLRSIARP